MGDDGGDASPPAKETKKKGGKKDDGGGAGGALLAVFKGGLSIKKPKVSLIFDAINSNDSVALAAALVASRGQGNLDPNNAYDEWGHTPLHYAAALGRPDMCRYLCASKGTRVNIRANPARPNQEQRTPLHLAAISCDLETVRVLLEFGANTSAQDVNGMKPVDLSGNDRIKRMIKSAGETTTNCFLASEVVKRYFAVNMLVITKPILSYEAEHIKRFGLTYEAMQNEIRAYRKTLQPGMPVPPTPKTPTNKAISDTVTHPQVGTIFVAFPRKEFGVNPFAAMIRCANTEYDGDPSFLVQDIWVGVKLRGQRLGVSIMLHTLIYYTQKLFKHALVYIPQGMGASERYFTKVGFRMLVQERLPKHLKKGLYSLWVMRNIGDHVPKIEQLLSHYKGDDLDENQDEYGAHDELTKVQMALQKRKEDRLIAKERDSAIDEFRKRLGLQKGQKEKKWWQLPFKDPDPKKGEFPHHSIPTEIYVADKAPPPVINPDPRAALLPTIDVARRGSVRSSRRKSSVNFAGAGGGGGMSGGSDQEVDVASLEKSWSQVGASIKVGEDLTEEGQKRKARNRKGAETTDEEEEEGEGEGEAGMSPSRVLTELDRVPGQILGEYERGIMQQRFITDTVLKLESRVRGGRSRILNDQAVSRRNMFHDEFDNYGTSYTAKRDDRNWAQTRPDTAVTAIQTEVAGAIGVYRGSYRHGVSTSSPLKTTFKGRDEDD